MILADKSYVLGAMFIQFLLADELWYTTTRSEGIIYHVIHLGFSSLKKPSSRFPFRTFHIITFSFLILNVRVGLIQTNGKR